MTHFEIIPRHCNSDDAIANVIANIVMESPRIHLPYWDVHKFWNDGMDAEKIPKMLWKMLQELGYKKQQEYFGTQETCERFEPV
jgi:hypothetical protein